MDKMYRTTKQRIDQSDMPSTMFMYYLDARNLDQGEPRHQTIQFIMLCNDGKIYRYLFGA